MRLLSYNIHKGIGGRDRRYRIERVIDVIEQENPDILCLQEVARNSRRSSFHDQPTLIAEYFNAGEQLYQMNVHLKRGGYGNLILSRWGFQSTHQISLRFNRKKPRGAQIVVVQTPEGCLRLVNWHLGLAERERHWQALHLFNHHFFREGDGLPTIIAGDFNDWRNTLGAGPFALFNFEQATSPPSRFRTFPAYLSVGSLDKAFYRGDMIVRHVRIVRTPGARLASDHLPLSIDFHLGTAPLPEIVAEQPRSPGSE
jgi:endonuclease/exonuclease/phosphatase family metal-dependent hydrolase